MADQSSIKPGTKVTDRKETIRGYQHRPGGEALEVFKKDEVYKKLEVDTSKATLPEDTLRCRTQKPAPPQLKSNADVLRIWVGLFVNVTRWKKGSVVNFATYRNGYPQRDWAVYSANALNQAADIWNSKDVGVTFAWVDKLEDANFVLSYGGNDGGTIASAYFPNEDDLNIVYVYERAFQPDAYPHLYKYFLHELGHVLGLRHEFSMDQGPRFEGGAVQFGVRNPLSVMNYRPEAPEIQESDVTDTKAFIDLEATEIGGLPLLTYVPNN